MSPLDRKLIDLTFRALDAGPSRVRTYPATIEQDDAALRDQLKLEAQDEPRYRSREDRESDYYGVSRFGEL